MTQIQNTSLGQTKGWYLFWCWSQVQRLSQCWQLLHHPADDPIEFLNKRKKVTYIWLKEVKTFWRIEINWSNKWKILSNYRSKEEHNFPLDLLSFFVSQTDVYDLSRSVLQPITWSYLTTGINFPHTAFHVPLRAGMPSISRIIRHAIDASNRIVVKEKS